MNGRIFFSVFVVLSIVVTEAKCWHSEVGTGGDKAFACKRNGCFLLAPKILCWGSRKIYDKIPITWIFRGLWGWGFPYCSPPFGVTDRAGKGRYCQVEVNDAQEASVFCARVKKGTWAVEALNSATYKSLHNPVYIRVPCVCTCRFLWQFIYTYLDMICPINLRSCLFRHFKKARVCLLRVQSVSCWTISWPSQCLEPNWRHQKFNSHWPFHLPSILTAENHSLWLAFCLSLFHQKIGTISNPDLLKKNYPSFRRTRRTPGINTFSDWGTLSEIPPTLRSSSTCSWVFSNSLSWSSTWACLKDTPAVCGGALQIASEFDLLGYVGIDTLYRNHWVWCV